MPTVCTFWRTGDYLGMLLHEPVDPGIGFSSSVFPNGRFSHVSLKCLVAATGLPGSGASWITDALPCLVYTSEVNHQGCFVNIQWLLPG